MEYIKYIVVAIYFIFLALIGIVSKRLVAGESDYFRAGCRGNWWMVGMSLFMSGISTQTFVANSGVAYRAGFSILGIYLTNTVCHFLLFLGIAAWYRQARVTTFAEIVKERFGTSFQQFFTYQIIVWYVIYAGAGLYQLSLFTHIAFNFPIIGIILGLGGIALFYTMTGGNWAVLTGDFLQSLILLPMIVLLAVLCLVKIGGIGNFFEAINSSPQLSRDFQFIKDSHPDGLYSLKWLIGVSIIQVYVGLGMTGGHRFFACKDGWEARKAVLLCLIVSVVGALLFFIPPMTARILYDAEVMSINAPSPQDISYAFMSRKLLPFGFLPLMTVAMFAAQLSTMDTSLNNNSAVFVKNAYPALVSLFGKKPSQDPVFLLKLGRIFTFFLGCGLISMAVYFALNAGTQGFFETTFKINSVLALPMFIPLFIGVFIRRTPWWSGWLCMLCTFAASLYGFFTDAAIFDISIYSSITGISVFALSAFFWRYSSAESRDNIKKLFVRMHTPVDFEKEVGRSNDVYNYKAIGIMASVMGAMIWLFLLFPNSFKKRLCILAVALCVQSVGVLMLALYFRGRKKAEKLEEIE